MKKAFEEAKVEVILLNRYDVIVTSGEGAGEGDDSGDGGDLG